MNPISIKFVNFRNYKDETIVFPHSGVMPIVGKNGTGKSTIFYGILLALYGKVLIDDAETSVKELIIDDGSKDMSVEYKFSHDGLTYEIIREYRLSKTKNDIAKCDQVKCELNQIIGKQIIPLTAKSKSITSEKVVDILGKDCSNFCNSAFFPQDEANRLARLRPAEFIEEVSKLKKITVWELLREKAVNKLNKVTVMLDGIDHYLETCKLEIEQKGDVQLAIDGLNKKIMSAKDDIKKIEIEVSKITKEKDGLVLVIDNVKRIESDLQSVNIEINDFIKEKDGVERNINEQGGIVSRKAEIEEKFTEFQSLENSKELLDTALMNRSNLTNQISNIENEVNNAKLEVERLYQQAITNNDNAIAVLQNADEVELQHENCRQSIESLSLLEAQTGDIENENREILVRISAIKTTNENLSERINEETVKMQQFMKDRICFECERPVDDNGMNFIKGKKIEKIDSYKLQGRDNVEKMNLLEEQLKNNNEQLLVMNNNLSKKSSFDRELGQLETQIGNITVARETSNRLVHEINHLKSIIDSGAYSDKTETLVSLRQQLGAIVYNQDEHQSVRVRHGELKGFLREKEKLDTAERELPGLVERKNNLVGKIENKQTMVSKLSKDLDSFDRSNLDSKLSVIQAREEEATETLSRNRDEFTQLMRDFGAQQQIMESIIKKEEELNEKMEESADLKEEQFLLERAIEMYSKSGIPTLIIENMLPEIENQTNELLKTMQADRTISFERPKRADGSYQDKIIIMIRDRRGKKRTFNTYSGAECFQISFALRVAICGGEEVMFIDEGFGKLDPDNLTLIMRTLSAMKSQFDKIILITHVRDLIEMFDVKLNVEIDKDGYSAAKWTKVA